MTATARSVVYVAVAFCSVVDGMLGPLPPQRQRILLLTPFISIFGLLNVYSKNPELPNYLKRLHDIPDALRRFHFRLAACTFSATTDSVRQQRKRPWQDRVKKESLPFFDRRQILFLPGLLFHPFLRFNLILQPLHPSYSDHLRSRRTILANTANITQHGRGRGNRPRKRFHAPCDPLG